MSAESELGALRDEVARLKLQLRSAADVGRLGVWEHDFRTSRARWDDAMFRFYAFDPAAGPPDYEVLLQRIHPDDRERVDQLYRGSMQRLGRYDDRYRVLLPDGRESYMHNVWQTLPGADGQPGRLAGVVLDDTESVRNAHRHQAANTQLALAVGLVGISLWRVDLATQRIQLNDWGYHLIGRTPRPDGMPVDEMRESIHPEDRQKIVDAGRQATRGSGIVDTEARYRRPDGSYRTLLTRRIAERDEHGQPIALVGVSLDVTEQVEERERARQMAQSIDLIADA